MNAAITALEKGMGKAFLQAQTGAAAARLQKVTKSGRRLALSKLVAEMQTK